jgi:hypothetical protein
VGIADAVAKSRILALFAFAAKFVTRWNAVAKRDVVDAVLLAALMNVDAAKVAAVVAMTATEILVVRKSVSQNPVLSALPLSSAIPACVLPAERFAANSVLSVTPLISR